MNGSGRTLVPTLLLILATVDSRLSQAQEQLLLTADVGKSEFFEGEPIYLMVRLQNVGVDTARTYIFNLLSPAVTVSLKGRQGTTRFLVNYVLDYRTPASWLGEALAPGAAVLKTMVLQTLLGAEQDLRNHLFAHHLAPNDYELNVEFNAHLNLSRTLPLTIQARPIAFRIRERTRVEEDEVKQLEGMRRDAWEKRRVTGNSQAARVSLMGLIERRLREWPDDPFLPFLLTSGFVAADAMEEQSKSGRRVWFDADTSALVTQWRLAIIDRHRHSPGGALLVQAFSEGHADQLTVLAERLRGTPAGDMAQYEAEQKPHGKQVRQP
jgi:hypothetical protein